MNPFLALVLAFVALGVPVGYVAYEAGLSPDNWIYKGNGQWTDGGYHGAPGPIAGAGLPVLAIGFGVYWIVRRRRKVDE
jgi:hypothetical protein